MTRSGYCVATYVIVHCVHCVLSVERKIKPQKNRLELTFT